MSFKTFLIKYALNMFLFFLPLFLTEFILKFLSSFAEKSVIILFFDASSIFNAPKIRTPHPLFMNFKELESK